MAEYIERKKILELLNKLSTEPLYYHSGEDWYCGIATAEIEIASMDIADVVKVRHGEWVHTDMAASWHAKDECSECHYRTADRVDLSRFNYCPNCGAKMDGKGADPTKIDK